MTKLLSQIVLIATFIFVPISFGTIMWAIVENIYVTASETGTVKSLSSLLYLVLLCNIAMVVGMVLSLHKYRKSSVCKVQYYNNVALISQIGYGVMLVYLLTIANIIFATKVGIFIFAFGALMFACGGVLNICKSIGIVD